MLVFIDLEEPVLILYLPNVSLTSKIILFLLRTSIDFMCVCATTAFIHSLHTQKHVFRAYRMSGTLLGTAVRVWSKLRSVSHSYEAQSL